MQQPRGRKVFRSVCVKPYAGPRRDEDQDQKQGELEQSEGKHQVSGDDGRDMVNDTDDCCEKGCGYRDVLLADDVEDLETTSRKVKVKEGSKEEAMFAEPRRAELEGLMENGTFKKVDKADIPNGARVFGARFVDEIKRTGTGLRKKSLLFPQN